VALMRLERPQNGRCSGWRRRCGVPVDDRLADLARAVLDSAEIDWLAAGQGTSAELQQVIEELRLLASLASVHRRNHGGSPASTWSPEALAKRLTPDRPATWGHLKIVERIGRGASATVYRAWDPRLDREVAVKIMPAPRPWDDTAASSIIEEGRLLARVRHPNVAAIHGAEQIDNQVGLTMEFVRGRTLEERLRSGHRFEAAEAISIGIQLCSALSAVHQAGLLHRDVKATNIIQTETGRVVLMDFGTGRDLDDDGVSDLTGTPLYLAPEVFLGEAATTRSDIYSVGVVLYRLVTGSYPTQAGTIDEMRAAHERREHVSLRARPGVPQFLVDVIERALQPDEARRHLGADAMGEALVAAQRRLRRRVLPMALAAGLALTTMSLAWISILNRAPPADPGPRLLVLPFEVANTQPQGDRLAIGLSKEVQRSVGGLRGITTLAFPWETAFSDKHRRSVVVGEGVGADLVLEGVVIRNEGATRLDVRLIRLADSVDIWRGEFDMAGKAILRLPGELTDALAKALHVGQGHERLRRPWPSLEAAKLMAIARSFDDRRDQPNALLAADSYDRATKADPDHAPAWAGLSRSLAHAHRLRAGDQNQTPDPRIQVGADTALRIDDSLAEAHAAMGNVYAEARKWVLAEKSFRRALELAPSLTSVHTDFALSVLMPMERIDEAIALLQGALRVEPNNLDVARVLAHFQVNARRYEDAIKTARWVLEVDPTFPFAAMWLGRALALTQQYDEALTIFESDNIYWSYRGYTYAVMGRREDAKRLALSYPHSPREQMFIYAGLKEVDRAIDALERLVAGNVWRASTWLQRPELDALRDHPRFRAIRRELGLPELSGIAAARR
jgi:tetratricopeptide (TPR) repeat protein/tRNA A-37 threonylcarbamoyl transferase component Bud32